MSHGEMHSVLGMEAKRSARNILSHGRDPPDSDNVSGMKPLAMSATFMQMKV